MMKMEEFEFIASTKEKFQELEEKIKILTESYSIRNSGVLQAQYTGIDFITISPTKDSKIEDIVPMSGREGARLIASSPEFVHICLKGSEYLIRYKP
jgi:hypothetical protein